MTCMLPRAVFIVCERHHYNSLLHMLDYFNIIGIYFVGYICRYDCFVCVLWTVVCERECAEIESRPKYEICKAFV